MSPHQIEFILKEVSERLPAAGIDFIMIGGHAVNHYGYSRATMDIDFMIASDDAPAVRDVMRDVGFTNISASENVVFFGHPESPHRVDFLRVGSATMQELLSRAQQTEYANAPIAVPSLEDLIAMKLFALKSGALTREEKDLPDVVHLIVEHGLNLDTTIKPLCLKYADEALFNKIAARVREVKNA